MTSTTVYLQALNDKTGATARVVLGDDLDINLKALFEKIYGEVIGAVKWFAGVPGKDKAVVWQGTPYQGSEQYYLHVSYSDGRLWS